MTVCDDSVVITGPPGSGKTPLLAELMSLGFRGVEEPARAVIAEQRAIGGRGVYDQDRELFFDLMLSRAVEDFRRMAGAESGRVFFDRAIPDLIGYAELFDLDPAPAMAAAGEHRYNRRVFALPSWPEIYVTDDERRMSYEGAAAFGDRVRSAYEQHGYDIVDVPRDTVAARARFIVDTFG